MRQTISGAVTIRLLPLAFLLAACGDARLKQLDRDISRDSALRVLGIEAAPGDSMPHIYREAQYLVNGDMYLVAFYTPTDRKEATDTTDRAETIPDRQLTPLVFVNDRLTGWGWQHWEDVAKSIHLPVVPRE